VRDDHDGGPEGSVDPPQRHRRIRHQVQTPEQLYTGVREQPTDGHGDGKQEDRFGQPAPERRSERKSAQLGKRHLAVARLRRARDDYRKRVPRQHQQLRRDQERGRLYEGALVLQLPDQLRQRALPAGALVEGPVGGDVLSEDVVDPVEVVDADRGDIEHAVGGRHDAHAAECAQQVPGPEDGVQAGRPRFAHGDGRRPELEQVLVEPVRLAGVRRPVEAGDDYRGRERIAGAGLDRLCRERRDRQLTADSHAERDGTAAGQQHLVGRSGTGAVHGEVLALSVPPYQPARRPDLAVHDAQVDGGQHDLRPLEVPVDPLRKGSLGADRLLGGDRRDGLLRFRGVR